MSYSKIFFTNVLRLASEKNLSHQDLAERANLSPSSMSGITRGQGNPTLETMSAIAYALDVPLSYLLEHHDLDPESLSLLDGNQHSRLITRRLRSFCRVIRHSKLKSGTMMP